MSMLLVNWFTNTSATHCISSPQTKYQLVRSDDDQEQVLPAAEETASSPEWESCCFHSTFSCIICKDPRCGGKPALLAHPPLPVARGTQSGEPGMWNPAFRRLGEGQREEEEQPHPSPTWPMIGTKETGGPAPALSLIQEQPCTDRQQVCSICCTPVKCCSKEAESSNTNPSTWAQGSLFGSGAWGVQASRDVPLYWSGHRSMCIPQECSHSPSVLKQFVLAHICACHKSILLLKASCSHCSSHTGAQGAVLQNCMQKFLAFSLKSIFCNRFICNDDDDDIFTAKSS